MSPDDPLKYWVSAVDTVSDGDARRVAAGGLFGGRPGSGQADVRVDGSSQERTWQSLHNVADPGAVGTTCGPVTVIAIPIG